MDFVLLGYRAGGDLKIFKLAGLTNPGEKAQ
jgi:hypothetical protein